MTEPTICASFPTIMSGLVVRWYADEAAYREGCETASASRDQHIVYAGDDLPIYGEVQQRIAAHGHDADLADVLTHKALLFRDDLVPL